MEKRAFLRAEHMTAILVIYVAGFIVVFLMLKAQVMVGETPVDTSALADAALWPVSLWQMLM